MVRNPESAGIIEGDNATGQERLTPIATSIPHKEQLAHSKQLSDDGGEVEGSLGESFNNNL